MSGNGQVAGRYAAARGTSVRAPCASPSVMSSTPCSSDPAISVFGWSPPFFLVPDCWLLVSALFWFLLGVCGGFPRLPPHRPPFGWAGQAGNRLADSPKPCPRLSRPLLVGRGPAGARRRGDNAVRTIHRSPAPSRPYHFTFRPEGFLKTLRVFDGHYVTIDHG